MNWGGKMKNNPVLNAVLTELETAGARIVSVGQTKHYKIQYEQNGSTRTTTAPVSPPANPAPYKAA